MGGMEHPDASDLLDDHVERPRRKVHTWDASLTDGTREKSTENLQTGDSNEVDELAACVSLSSERCHSISSEPSEEVDAVMAVRSWGRSHSAGAKKKPAMSSMVRPSLRVLADALEKATQNTARDRAQGRKPELTSRTEGLREASSMSSEATATLAQSFGSILSPNSRGRWAATASEPLFRSEAGSEHPFITARENGQVEIGRKKCVRISPDRVPQSASQKTAEEIIRRKSSRSPRSSECHRPPQFGLQPSTSTNLSVGDWYDPELEGGNVNTEIKVSASIQRHYNMNTDSDDELPISVSNSENRRFSSFSDWLSSDSPQKEVETYRQRLHQAEQELQQVAEIGQMLLNRNQELEAQLQDMSTKPQENDGVQFWKRKIAFLEQEITYQQQQLASAQEVEQVQREKMRDLQAEVEELRSNSVRHTRRTLYTHGVDSPHEPLTPQVGPLQEHEDLEQRIQELASHNQALEEEVLRLERVVRNHKSRETELEAKLEEHERRLTEDQLVKQAEVERLQELEDLGVFL